ncbi:MAG TPA: hypothetical protein VG757_13425 [Devosia sp.]|nr:hypothetical protein [Devosia sp.]
MSTKRLVGLAMASALIASQAAAGAEGWELTGVWKLNAKCANWHGINFVTIGEADAHTVLGTTNVDDGYGRIVDGKFDGVNVEFTNKYLWNGRRYTEYWHGKISNGGKVMRGSFTTTNTEEIGPCTFSGRRQ